MSGSSYRLTNLHSGKVLDAINCGTANGTKVQLWMWLNNPCQLWSFSA
ncbi:RICIN domain-containing protein [Actinoplanes subtropicus]